MSDLWKEQNNGNCKTKYGITFLTISHYDLHEILACKIFIDYNLTEPFVLMSKI